MQPALTPTRLVLRPLAADDGPHLADIFAGAEVRRDLFDNQEVPPASIAALVEENLARRAAGLGLWLICRDNHVIGCVGLQRVPPHTVEIYPTFEGEIETIIALKEDQWGAGYATEAARRPADIRVRCPERTAPRRAGRCAEPCLARPHATLWLPRDRSGARPVPYN